MAGPCGATIRSGERKGQPCGRNALNGTEREGKPGVCYVHGGQLPSIKTVAALRRAEADIAAEAEKTGREAAPNQSPLSVLEETLSDMVALKNRLRETVDRLTDSSLRYEGRAGEQIRGELQAYGSALRDTVKASEAMLKLGIAERRLELDQRMSLALLWIVEQSLAGLGVNTDSEAVRQIVQAKIIEAGDLDERQHAVAAVEAKRR